MAAGWQKNTKRSELYYLKEKLLQSMKKGVKHDGHILRNQETAQDITEQKPEGNKYNDINVCIKEGKDNPKEFY